METTDSKEKALKAVVDIGQVHRRAQMNMAVMYEQGQQAVVPKLGQLYMDLVQRPELNVEREMQQMNRVFSQETRKLERVIVNKERRKRGEKIIRRSKVEEEGLVYSDCSDEEEEAFESFKQAKKK